MLDWLGPDYITRDEVDLSGYDVPCYPFFLAKPTNESEGIPAEPIAGESTISLNRNQNLRLDHRLSG